VYLPPGNVFASAIPEKEMQGISILNLSKAYVCCFHHGPDESHAVFQTFQHQTCYANRCWEYKAQRLFPGTTIPHSAMPKHFPKHEIIGVHETLFRNIAASKL
jgi:hypothetical protein